jgi:hypothetical protein
MNRVATEPRQNTFFVIAIALSFCACGVPPVASEGGNAGSVIFIVPPRAGGSMGSAGNSVSTVAEECDPNDSTTLSNCSGSSACCTESGHCGTSLLGSCQALSSRRDGGSPSGISRDGGSRSGNNRGSDSWWNRDGGNPFNISRDGGSRSSNDRGSDSWWNRDGGNLLGRNRDGGSWTERDDDRTSATADGGLDSGTSARGDSGTQAPADGGNR